MEWTRKRPVCERRVKFSSRSLTIAIGITCVGRMIETIITQAMRMDQGETPEREMGGEKQITIPTLQARKMMRREST